MHCCSACWFFYDKILRAPDERMMNREDRCVCGQRRRRKRFCCCCIWISTDNKDLQLERNPHHLVQIDQFRQTLINDVITCDEHVCKVDLTCFSLELHFRGTTVSVLNATIGMGRFQGILRYIAYIF